MSELILFKKFLHTVSCLTEKDCSLFEPYLSVKKYTAKDIFLTEGKICIEIGFINKGCFQTSYFQSQNWERFGRIVAEQSYKLTTHRGESFLFLDGEQRYLDLLKNQPRILERIPLYHIASYLGLERESLSRLRKKIAGKQQSSRKSIQLP